MYASKHSSFNISVFHSDLEECESYLLELNLLLKSMEVLHRTYSAPAISALQVSTRYKWMLQQNALGHGVWQIPVYNHYFENELFINLTVTLAGPFFTHVLQP